MELKLIYMRRYLTLKICSNRTFMELKCASLKADFGRLPSSNRTFMELKWRSLEQEDYRHKVLIAPLWN